MSWCRLCCNPKDQCIDIFNYQAVESDGSKIPLEVKIYNCFQNGIYPNDGLSSLICYTCLSFVNTWYAFKVKVDQCDSKQRNWIQMPGFKVNSNTDDSASINEEMTNVEDVVNDKIRKIEQIDEGCSSSFSVHDLMTLQMAKQPKETLNSYEPECMLKVDIGGLKESTQSNRQSNKRIRKKPQRLKNSLHFSNSFGSNTLAQDENMIPDLLYNPKCTDCVSIVKKNNELTKHMIIVHGAAGQIIECSYCEQTYLTEPSMKNHVFKAHGVRNMEVKMIKCDYCEINVKSLPDMKKHIISDHQDMSHKLLNCTICPEQFINLTGLKAHLYKIHNVFKEDYHSVIPEIMAGLTNCQTSNIKSKAISM